MANKDRREKIRDREEVRALVVDHLTELGFVHSGGAFELLGPLTKERIRKLYEGARQAKAEKNRDFLGRYFKELADHFASGGDLDPSRISPVLEIVETGGESARVFRLATLLWSVPVSAGYGRRMRFVVRDAYNGKVIGIFALGDPVFNLKARDQWIGWDSEDRKHRLSHVMDAYVVGAVPPYSLLIGGKLVALLTTCSEVRELHRLKYSGRTSVITQDRTYTPDLPP